MSITLLQARTNTRQLLDEATAQFWTDAQLNTWLNEACADTQRRGEWKETVATLPVIAETQSYPAPDNVLRIHKIVFQPTLQGGNNQNTYTLEYRGFMEMDQVWGINQQWPASYPLYYTLWGQPGTGTMQIMTYPVPSQAGNLLVYYYPEVNTAVNDTDKLDIAQGFEDMTYDYCMYRALRKDADPRWQEAKATYEEKLVSLVDSSRTYQDQAGTFATGQQALPNWLTSGEGW
jgi:hypothetical protein